MIRKVGEGWIGVDRSGKGRFLWWIREEEVTTRYSKNICKREKTLGGKIIERECNIPYIRRRERYEDNIAVFAGYLEVIYIYITYRDRI